MFTGIVEEIGVVAAVRPGGLAIRASNVLDGLSVGDSVSVNGACLTATELGPDSFSVDVVPETLRRTNLGSLAEGSPVNLERSVPAGGRLDGHIVQGHVDRTGRIESIREDGDAVMVSVEAAPPIMRYVVEKGFIALDGVSLTIVECDEERFSVTIIPHTREHTIMGSRKDGDTVNIEVDILAKYVERLVSRRAPTKD
jgi:riboflavin synthase